MDGHVFGLGLHTLMDGVALGASVAAEAHHTSYIGLAGLGTFLAVVLHKPLDAFAITSVMRKGGWTTTQQGLVNFLFSLACPIGAMLFFFGATYFPTTARFWDGAWRCRPDSSSAFRWPIYYLRFPSTTTTPGS